LAKKKTVALALLVWRLAT